MRFFYCFIFFIALIYAEEVKDAQKEEKQENIPPPKVYLEFFYESSIKCFGYVLMN